MPLLGTEISSIRNEVMKNYRTFFLLAGVFFFLLSTNLLAHTKKAKPLPHFKEGITKVSEEGLYSVEIVLEPLEPKIGKNKVKVYLHDADGRDLEKAIVSLEVKNKNKGVTSGEKTNTIETAGGEYIIRNVVYESPDVYELVILITKDGKADKAVFEIEVK